MRRICKRQTRKLVLLPPIQENVAAAIKEDQLTQQQDDGVVKRVRAASASKSAAIPEQSWTEGQLASGVPEVDRASPPGERHQAWFTSVVTEGIQEATVASKVSATEETRPDEF